ncbi:unnamed protein product [Moneuplotes crassus]|uniref:Uncharacterized protein n=1 Tax=Euplotes crassus TaxID=5936 RepID=A0AAD1XBE7_EUPCR|nr:unnamed protein product [Moneuplotes crassus]
MEIDSARKDKKRSKTTKKSDTTVVATRNNEYNSAFPELNKSMITMEDQMKHINKKIYKILNRRKDEFDHAKSLERRKHLNKEAYQLLQNNTRQEEVKLRKKYKTLISNQLCELHNSPKEENRIIEEKMQMLKERALQRAIQVNLEIKKNSDWTMPKLVQNVLNRKERIKEEKQKELDQIKAAKDLRHQLAHRNVLSNMGQWFTKNLSVFTNKGKLKSKQKSIKEDKIEEEIQYEKIYSKMIPTFNMPDYARDKDKSFQRVHLGRAFMIDQAIFRELKKHGKNNSVITSPSNSLAPLKSKKNTARDDLEKGKFNLRDLPKLRMTCLEKLKVKAPKLFEEE